VPTGSDELLQVIERRAHPDPIGRLVVLLTERRDLIGVEISEPLAQVAKRRIDGLVGELALDRFERNAVLQKNEVHLATIDVPEVAQLDVPTPAPIEAKKECVSGASSTPSQLPAVPPEARPPSRPSTPTQETPPHGEACRRLQPRPEIAGGFGSRPQAKKQRGCTTIWVPTTWKTAGRVIDGSPRVPIAGVHPAELGLAPPWTSMPGSHSESHVAEASTTDVTTSVAGQGEGGITKGKG